MYADKVKKHLRVAVVSPGDVQRERDELPDILNVLNKGIAEEKGYHLDLYRWETDVYPHFHPKGPQGAIDETLKFENCDIIIGIFWKRFGTPVNDANSGTEHELRLAYNVWKKTKKRPLIMIYFNKEPYSPKNIEEAEQLRRVFEFQKTFAPEALYGQYEGLDDFRQSVTNDLTQIVRQMPPNDPKFSDAEQPPHDPASNQSWENYTFDSLPLHTF